MMNRLRIFIFDFWHYLLFGIFALVVILSVVYFNQSVYEERQHRLQDVSVDQVIIEKDIEPPANPDRLVQGFLLPTMNTYLPLPPDWSIREEWGEPVDVRSLRTPEIPLQVAPPSRGPQASP